MPSQSERQWRLLIRYSDPTRPDEERPANGKDEAVKDWERATWWAGNNPLVGAIPILQSREVTITEWANTDVEES